MQLDLWHSHSRRQVVVEQALQAHPRDALVQQVGHALLGELRHGQADPYYIAALYQTLDLHLRRIDAHVAVPSQTSGAGLAASTLQQLIAHIDAHLANSLTLVELAKLAGISRCHLARRFRESTGQSLHQYITGRRLEHARELLATSAHTIAEVAQLAGFADQSHLHRQFKRRYGVTPGQSTKIQRDDTNIQDARSLHAVG